MRSRQSKERMTDVNDQTFLNFSPSVQLGNVRAVNSVPAEAIEVDVQCLDVDRTMRGVGNTVDHQYGSRDRVN
jgi:hypothetical protein